MIESMKHEDLYKALIQELVLNPASGGGSNFLPPFFWRYLLNA